MTTTPTLDALSITVTDMPITLAFYRRLSLPIPATADAEPYVEHTLPSGLRLMWCTPDIVRSYDPTWTPPTNPSRLNLAFRCPTPADVDTLYADLVSAGATPHLSPWDAVWGQRYAVLHDPDGNGIDLFCPLPA